MSEYAKKDECGHIFECGCKFVHFYPEESAEWLPCKLHKSAEDLLKALNEAIRILDNEWVDGNIDTSEFKAVIKEANDEPPRSP